ncbi:hypothetical protein SETIT_3G039000v2 [Setaria italica]|uniref:Uncharacterized protein n=1 Tax=Setaria italica TaxID=4555 RepID=A0A368QBV6_SETIT|nr:hypothetical protein SETIT_3G039000v2 [Setaria italica]
MERTAQPSKQSHSQRCSRRPARRRLELDAHGVCATAAVEHAGGGATAAPVALTRHREAQHTREVALLAVLRGAHGDPDADPPLGALPRERRGHRARAPPGRHALHAGPRHRQCGAAAAAAQRERRQRHGGAELLPGVERRGPDPRVPAARVHTRRAVLEPEHGGEVVREGRGRGVEGQAAELGRRDVGGGVVWPEEQPREEGRREDEHRQEHDQGREASGSRGCHCSSALPPPLARRRQRLHGHGSKDRECSCASTGLCQCVRPEFRFVT